MSLLLLHDTRNRRKELKSLISYSRNFHMIIIFSFKISWKHLIKEPVEGREYFLPRVNLLEILSYTYKNYLYWKKKQVFSFITTVATNMIPAAPYLKILSLFIYQFSITFNTLLLIPRNSFILQNSSKKHFSTYINQRKKNLIEITLRQFRAFVENRAKF